MIQKLFIEYATKMQVATYVGVEDFADKFNFIFTVIVLLIATTVVTVKQYILKPISCYISTEVGGKNLLDYVENYCWVQGTIPISHSSDVPQNESAWNQLEGHKILYYQWVPFVLGLQCILFCIPRIIWQIICYNQTGMDLYHLISLANDTVRAKPDKREEQLNNLAKTIETLLYHHRETRTGKAARIRRRCFRYCGLFYSGKRMGNRLFATYLVIKLLYILNCLGQLYLLESFIGLNNRGGSFFGITMTRNIIRGMNWQSTLNFPRVGFCVVPIRQLAGYAYVTAQCALPVNMLSERVYVFLWYWLLLGAVVTATSVPLWLLRMAHRHSRTAFVRRHLHLNAVCSRADDLIVAKFVRQFLRHDGVFLLRMMSINAGAAVAGAVVERLWEAYKARHFARDLNCADSCCCSSSSDDDDGDGDGRGARHDDRRSSRHFPAVVGRNHTTIQLDGGRLPAGSSAVVMAKPSAPPPPSSSSGFSEDIELKKMAI